MTVKVPKDLIDSVRKVWLAGLGALAVAEEEGSKIFKTLVEKGEELEKKTSDSLSKVKETFESVAEKTVGSAKETVEKVTGSFDEKVAEVLHKLGVPTREEIATLTKRVEELTKAVDKLRKEATAKKETPSKSVKK